LCLCGQGIGPQSRSVVILVMLKESTSPVSQPSLFVKPRDRWRRASLVLQYAIFPVGILLLWQICSEAGFVRRNVFPPPSEVLLVWFDLVTGATDAAGRYSGRWLDHAWASTWRVFAGFAWGVA